MKTKPKLTTMTTTTDYSKLSAWLRPTDDIFADFAARNQVLDYDNPKARRVFIDRGAALLFVAHVDTVQTPEYMGKGPGKIFGAGFDDRLGCLLAFNLSARLGADLLLTDNEERCQSTAEHHIVGKYNWIAEFDRSGADVVTYGLDSKLFLSALRKHFKIGRGSYSDVCELDTDVCCVNIGIGYELAHSALSYIDLDNLNSQLAKFEAFFTENKDIVYRQDIKSRQSDYLKYPQLPMSLKPWSKDDYKQPFYCGDYVDDEYEADRLCDICGMDYGKAIYGSVLCEKCLNNLLAERELI